MERNTKQHDTPPLTADEKHKMRAEMTRFQELHRIHAPAAPVPWYTRFIPTAVPSYATVGMMVACTFTLGASEFSLPDDPLYSLKTGVIERAVLATTSLSPDLHERANRTVLARRLNEAERLMLERRYTTTSANILEKKIADTSAALDASLARVAAREPERAEAAERERDAILAKYDSVLDIIALRKRVGDPAAIDILIEEATNAYAGTLRTELSAAELAAIERAVMEHYADELLDEVESVHQQISTLVRGTADDVVSTRVRAKLETSNDALHRAEMATAADDPETALAELDTALRNARDALSMLAEELS